MVRGVSMLQGGLGGIIGNTATAAAGQVPGKLAEVPGLMVRGYQRGFIDEAAPDVPGLPSPNRPVPLVGRTIDRGETSGQSVLPPKSTTSTTKAISGNRYAPESSPEGVPNGEPQVFRQYRDLDGETRQAAQDVYVAKYKEAGGELPAKPTAARLKEYFLAHGLDAPITPQRVKATNEAVTAFLKKNKRPLKTVDEWYSIFDKSTLAVPATAGGAAVLYDGEGE